MESCENPQPPLLSRVLVLSDDLQTISRLKTLLEPHGSALHSVSSTAEALHLLPDGKFDLLVLDHDLASLESGEGLNAVHEHVRDVPRSVRQSNLCGDDLRLVASFRHRIVETSKARIDAKAAVP